MKLNAFRLVIDIGVQACKRLVYLVSMKIIFEAKSDPADIKGTRRKGQDNIARPQVAD